MISTEVSTLATLSYSAVFSYPLTLSELRRWFIGRDILTASLQTFTQKLIAKKTIVSTGELYSLRSDKDVNDQRKKRYISSAKKWLYIKRVTGCLSWIPTIQCIGISGGVAMHNAEPYDDIDVFLIVRNGTLWSTRCIVVFLTSLLGIRRERESHDIANKLCLNMLLDDSAMGTVLQRQTLYTAHEILQLQPIFVRENTYMNFLLANKWVERFLPQAWRWRMNSTTETETRDALRYDVVFRTVNSVLEYIQRWVISKHRTNEYIASNTVRFHPNDSQIFVKAEFQKRLRIHGIPLDKGIWGL